MVANQEAAAEEPAPGAAVLDPMRLASRWLSQPDRANDAAEPTRIQIVKQAAGNHSIRYLKSGADGSGGGGGAWACCLVVEISGVKSEIGIPDSIRFVGIAEAAFLPRLGFERGGAEAMCSRVWFSGEEERGEVAAYKGSRRKRTAARPLLQCGFASVPFYGTAAAVGGRVCFRCT
ncbi:hypothetical protein E2562_033215 [Oryza meyeriana var. granulata]|uniref:Uncharacterized protein n=1 Tax=Oryza meyeriana var. granulata TaxID=110450 RepID=A0A6G1BPX1_9ORYZ|nr:hypothetical protein E2562_033215 [Oryza meyeriana var. granulata]